MNKTMKIVIAVVVVLVIAAVVVFALLGGDKNKTNLKPIASADDLVALVDEIYATQTDMYGSLATNVVDVTDADMVKFACGLDNGNDLEYLVLSEPMMSSQAYSMVLAKVKDGVDANAVAKDMLDKVNPIKWICVAAEKVYATNSGDVVMLVMSNEEMAKSVYDAFKTLAGYTGTEYERVGEQL